MEIDSRYENNNLVILLLGELDESTADKTRRRIDGILNDGYYGDVIFDFSGVTFMDSTGIGVLLGRYKVIKKQGANVMLRSVNRQIDKVLSMSGIYTIMKKIS